MKKFFLIVSFVLCVPFFCTSCGDGQAKLNEYKITAAYDELEHKLSCSQQMVYVNNTGTDLEKLDLFLYANSFEKAKNNASSSSLNKAYYNGESYGNITIQGASQDGKECDFSVEDGHAILSVKLQKSIKKHEKCRLHLDYVVLLANVNHRLGYGENTINFGSFAPTFCVFENGFVHNNFSANGDPFYSEISNFYVEISYPKEYVIASSGTIKKNDKGKAEIVAKNVRDFCFVLSKKLVENSMEIDGTKVSYFSCKDDNAERHLNTAKNALIFFNKKFGKYPYKNLSVVQADFCFGGMEYPNLVLISLDVERDATYDYVIVHEIAHQWWYGLVGNNEFESAWIDESLTEYSSALFFEEYRDYGLEYDTIVSNALESFKQFKQVYIDVLGSVDESMDRSLNEFKTEPEYVNCVYTKGVLMYDSLRDIMGERRFFKALKYYFKVFKFKNAKKDDLIGCFCKFGGRETRKFVLSWLDGKVVFR